MCTSPRPCDARRRTTSRCPSEIAACADHLDAEVAALPRLQVVVALGKIAWDAWLAHLARHDITIRPKPAFGHGAIVSWNRTPLGTPGTLGTSGTMIGAFHPSRQNTNTGKVTAAMYDDIFTTLVKSHIDRADGDALSRRP